MTYVVSNSWLKDILQLKQQYLCCNDKILLKRHRYFLLYDNFFLLDSKVHAKYTVADCVNQPLVFLIETYDYVP